MRGNSEGGRGVGGDYEMKIDNFQDKQLILRSVFNLYILKYQLYTNASKNY